MNVCAIVRPRPLPPSRPVTSGDNRKLLFYHRGTLHMVNAETKKVTELLSPPPPYRVIGFGISKDNRTIFYGLASTDADVWLINL